MHRIDNASAAPALPSAGAVGNPGYYTRGDNTVSPPIFPTGWDQDAQNALQEELCNVVTNAGLTLEKGNYGQVWEAISTVFAPLISPAFTGRPTAPTPSAQDNTTALATTAFVTVAVEAEANRAEAAEAANAEAISAETSRAEAAESANSNAIKAEANRAQSAEGTLYSEIEAETSRAEGVENTKAPINAPTFTGNVGMQGSLQVNGTAQLGGTTINGGTTVAGGASLNISGGSGQLNVTGGAICQNGTWSGNTTSGYNPIYSSLTGVFLSDAVYSFNGSQASGYFGTGASGGHIVEFSASHGGVIGSIANSGDSSVAYNTTSDYRLKDNVEALDAAGSLAAVQQLRPVAFDWKGTGVHCHGFIAHELQAVFPDAVTGAKDAMRTRTVVPTSPTEYGPVGQPYEEQIIDPQMVDLTRLVPFLVSAVQHLAAELAALRGQPV